MHPVPDATKENAMPRTRERYLLGCMVGQIALLLCLMSPFAAGQEKTSETDPRLGRWLKRFPEADTDGDGVLTAKEAMAYREELKGKRGRSRGKQGGKVRPYKIPPTHENVQYGPHERNVFDFWQAESTEPTALVVFIHGGGFVGGDKSKASPFIVQGCRDAGVSFMSINYRFREHAPIQDILRDAARAVQFVRQNAGKYRIDPKRIACYGGSAGAGTSLWLAVHDDLADPNSEDPVLRQSSRIAVAGCLNGQATYDLTEWEEVIGPFKEEWRRSPNEKVEFYHLKSEADLDTPEGKKILADCSMLRQISSGDAPVFMSCSQPNEEPKNRGHYVHHPRHALAVKEKCESAGVECVTVLREDDRKGANPQQQLLQFLLKHLGVQPKGESGQKTGKDTEGQQR